MSDLKEPAMFDFDRSVHQKLQRQRARVDAPDAETLCIRGLPLPCPPFSASATDVLFRRKDSMFVVCVGADLEYSGSDAALAEAFTQDQDRGWRRLALPQVPDERFAPVLERTLEFLGFGGGQPSLQPSGPLRPPSESQILTAVCRDVTQEALDGRLFPVIGRSEETDRLQDVLAKQRKNNPVLLGDPGVGKTAVVEGLAWRIVKEQVSDSLVGARILELNIGLLQSGLMTGELGQWIQEIVHALQKEGHLLFVDELHMICSSGPATHLGHVGDLLKPALARGLRVIGATTTADYRSIEQDRAFARRFQKVYVAEPDEETTRQILKGVRGSLEDFHGCCLPDAALGAAVRLSQRYVTDRRLPDKAIDLLDETAAHLKRLGSAHAPEATAMEVQVADLADVIEAWTGVPAREVGEDEATRLLHMEDALSRRVKGQPQAISVVADAVRERRVQADDTRGTSGAFLLLGPSGVGKTEMGKALAEFLFGDDKALIRFDMSEYGEPHSVSRLIGAPPGYVGYLQGGQITEALKHRPYAVVLLDEVEKAHPQVLTIFLQAFSDGRLTDGMGNTVDLKNTIFLMSSNLGSAHTAELTKIGFGEERQTDQDKERVSRSEKALQRFFTPEFLGRVEVVRFAPLTRETLVAICGQKIEALGKSLGISIQSTEAGIAFLVREGTSPDAGARELDAAVRRHLGRPLAKMLLSSELCRNGSVRVETAGGGLSLTVVTQ
jgi:ATP-dependent Clp protease ATP-binding subunit ClpC